MVLLIDVSIISITDCCSSLFNCRHSRMKVFWSLWNSDLSTSRSVCVWLRKEVLSSWLWASLPKPSRKSQNVLVPNVVCKPSKPEIQICSNETGVVKVDFLRSRSSAISLGNKLWRLVNSCRLNARLLVRRFNNNIPEIKKISMKTARNKTWLVSTFAFMNPILVIKCVKANGIKVKRIIRRVIVLKSVSQNRFASFK